ncbi:hypothetical protein POM88_052136 [Heracleum sosnowskyi]|uniref:Uncharacterized protein n=1 Tax=Heracleum sosnowskyi TaxID=360622 RepID=A0AAD8GTH1_9APIA|nr:hypothetical protein POM88_052136 [Heracleum sosnowskyi]
MIVSEDGKMVYEGGSDGYVMGWLGNESLDSWVADKSIGIWKKEINGRLFRVGVIRGHEGPVRYLQASPSSVGGGFMLYSGGLDKSLRVWWVLKYSVDKPDGSSAKKSSEKSLISLY